jgi:hypothetical protein
MTLRFLYCLLYETFSFWGCRMKWRTQPGPMVPIVSFIPSRCSSAQLLNGSKFYSATASFLARYISLIFSLLQNFKGAGTSDFLFLFFWPVILQCLILNFQRYEKECLCCLFKNHWLISWEAGFWAIAAWGTQWLCIKSPQIYELSESNF